jgi:hypothetical protein
MSSENRVIDWRAVEDSLREWWATSTGLTTIYEDQRAPQPSYPYISLRIAAGTAPKPVKSEEIWQADGKIKLRRQNDFTLTAQIHVDSKRPECHPRSLIDGAVAVLDAPDQSALFSTVALGIRAIGQTQNLNLNVGGQWISRSMIDIRFGVAAVLTNTPAGTPGHFEKVEVSSTIDGLKNPATSNLELDNEILDPANP